MHFRVFGCYIYFCTCSRFAKLKSSKSIGQHCPLKCLKHLISSLAFTPVTMLPHPCYTLHNGKAMHYAIRVNS